MASRKGNPVHGWVILDKPEGISSSRAVGIVRKVFSAAKAGHGGTLDPLATGVLPIALGEATKTVSFAMQGSKSYAFTIAFGRLQVRPCGNPFALCLVFLSGADFARLGASSSRR